MAEVITQLSIFLANEPGCLERVCDALEEGEVNILGLSVSDTVDHAVVRLICGQPETAKNILENGTGLVVETEVLAVEISNKPGSLATIASKLAEEEINIEYAYSTVLPKSTQGVVYLRVSDTDAAKDLL